jgi:putative N6-adenine-specific DNA methylase
MKTFNVVARTLFGFEDLLIAELEQLGVTDAVRASRAVKFTADQEMLYRVNLWSRLSLRFMVPVHTFDCRSELQLYDQVRSIPWEEYMGVGDTLAVDAVANRSVMDHSLYVSLKTKDAVVDRFRDRFGSRPSVDLVRPSIRIHVHLSSDVATVSLDSSGDSLHKRGYRRQQGEAPLNEVLAAGMVQLSGWDRSLPLMDPMCGSGTILIEAAMLAGNRAPGLLRGQFGFERWRDYDADAWSGLKADAVKAARPVGVRLLGSDQDAEAVRNARSNARSAGVDEAMEWAVQPFQEVRPPAGGGMIITNPPYGARLSAMDLLGLYEAMGNAFKRHFAGYTAWVLTANSDAAKHIGLRPSKKIQLYNGSLECRYLKYEMYSGSRKAAKAPVKNEDHD